MSAEWPTVSIGDIAGDWKGSMAVGPFGSRMKADLYVPSGVRVVRGNNLSGGREPEGEYVHVSVETADSLASCCLIPGDLVFPHRGNIGEVGITPDDGRRYMLSTSLMKLSPDRKKVDPLYLMYFFKSAVGRSALLMNASQVGTPGIATPLKSLRSIQFPLPSLGTQKQISETLSKLDDRITLLRETNTTLEAIAQALFKSWFVDFDPVHAKMQGSAPAGMDEATAALFPDSFEELELGAVPKGWILGKLADIATLKGGKMLDKASFVESGEHPVFGGAGVMGYSNFFNAEGFVITVGRVGAYCGQYFWHQGKAWVNNNASLVSPLNLDHACWLFLWLKSVDMDLIKKGAAQPFVSNGDIADLKIVIPPSQVIEKFVQSIDPIFKKLSSITAQSKSLEVLRDTLLPRLISGRLSFESNVSEKAYV